MSSIDDFPSFQVEFLEEIEKLCLSLEEVESEQKGNDSIRFATLHVNDYELHEIVNKFVREIQDGV